MRCNPQDEQTIKPRSTASSHHDPTCGRRETSGGTKIIRTAQHAHPFREQRGPRNCRSLGLPPGHPALDKLSQLLTVWSCSLFSLPIISVICLSGPFTKNSQTTQPGFHKSERPDPLLGYCDVVSRSCLERWRVPSCRRSKTTILRRVMG